jgi:hypothetical protein
MMDDSQQRAWSLQFSAEAETGTQQVHRNRYAVSIVRAPLKRAPEAKLSPPCDGENRPGSMRVVR